MVDPTTTNRSFAIPTRGSDVGTWDIPLNTNESVLDTMLGGVLTTSVTSGTYDISATAYNYGILRFTGAIVGNIGVLLPARSCFYIIDNQTTGAGFYVQLSLGSGEAVAVPQGKATDIFTDGTNVRFRNLPDPATYWDYAGGTVPAWITGCTKVPWLVCDGTVYNISAFPVLGALLGSTWGGDGISTFAVPDLQNRVRVPLKSTLPRLTLSGLNGSTLGSTGGQESQVLVQGNLPALKLTVNTPSVPAKGIPSGATSSPTQAGSAGPNVFDGTNYAFLTVDLGGSGTPIPIAQPTAVHGLTFVKT